MTGLDLQLRDLAAAVDFPETPDLADTVSTRLAAQPRRRRLTRRTLAIALAALAVAVAGALAVPSARSAILEWLGIKGVELEFVDQLPQLPVDGDLDLGQRLTLAGAKQRAGYEVVEPPGELGKPIVYFREPPARGMVTFLYGRPGRVRLLLSQFDADYRPFIRKIADVTVKTTAVQVDGRPALWLDGAHYIQYEDANGFYVESRVRVADKVLLWRHKDLTFRLEGPVTRTQAIEIAEAVD